MSNHIEINIGSETFSAKLNDTKIAGAILETLPIKSTGKTWGDEIYFTIPVDMENEAPQEVVEVGDLAYWPQGNGFCIFYGPTPSSQGNEPRPASPVTVIGEIEASASELKSLSNLEIEVKQKED